MNLQVKLLHVLDEKKILRIGGEKDIEVKARIIAATNRELKELVEEGKFRENLYYRLNVVPIELPPLRNRREDIPFLIKEFLVRYKEEHGVEKNISEEAFNILINYDYPGNIRELGNLIERLIITTPDEVIKKEQIESIVDIPRQSCFDIDEIIPIKKAVAELEKNILMAAFKKYKTTRRVAEVLEIDQSTVVKKAKKLEIDT